MSRTLLAYLWLVPALLLGLASPLQGQDRPVQSVGKALHSARRVRGADAGGPTGQRPANAADVNWQDGFGPSGLNMEVNALVTAANGDVFAGGNFYCPEGNCNANFVARWDGDRWNALGTAPLTAAVYALALAPNGDLIAGGTFANHLPHIARWNGTRWQTLGTGLNHDVMALLVLPNGDILAGGSFSNAGGNAAADRIARWDGATWHAFGAGLGASVRALAVLPNGDVVAGGDFLNAGGDPLADYIARWDGTAWRAMGPGLNATVRALKVAPTGELMVGGDFTDAGGNAQADFGAQWNGTAWQPIYPPLNGSVLAITYAANGDLLLGGGFANSVDTLKFFHVLRRHVAQWESLDNGFDPRNTHSTCPDSIITRGWIGAQAGVHAIVEQPNGDLMVGGKFYGTRTLYSRNIAHWSGTQWVPMGGNGLNLPATGLDQLPSGEVLLTTREYLGGVGLTPWLYYLIRWDGAAWSYFATVPGPVYAMTVTPAGDLIIGTTPSLSTPQSSIMRWNGVGWDPIGVNGNDETRMLAAAPNGGIVALRQRNGGQYVDYWNGANWQMLGRGMPLSYYLVSTITPAGDILIGGAFTNLGPNQANYLARWDGTAWQPVGAGPGSPVRTIFPAADGRVWVGHTNGLACWTSGVWSQVPGLGANSMVTALAPAPNGHLLVSGVFSNAGGNPDADGIARWDGTTWHALGSGINGATNHMLVRPNGDVVIANGFTRTGDGGKWMYQFGIYHDPTITGLSAPTLDSPALHLFPNPAHATVQLRGATAPSATVFDALGRPVLQVPLHEGQATIELVGLLPGLYVVRAGSQVRRLVVE